MEIVPVGELDQAGDEIERRRLAAPGGADQSDELAVLHRQRDVVDGEHVAVALDHVLEA